MTSVYAEKKVGRMMSCILSLKKHLPCSGCDLQGANRHKLLNYEYIPDEKRAIPVQACTGT